MIRRPPRSTLFPYTTALPIYQVERAILPSLGFTNEQLRELARDELCLKKIKEIVASGVSLPESDDFLDFLQAKLRSEEHTSELQSHLNLVCRLLLEKKKTKFR